MWLHLPDEPAPVEITNLFDEDGEEVADWGDAFAFVAGPLASGGWMTALCADYSARPLN
jgi:hypothetical protein